VVRWAIQNFLLISNGKKEYSLQWLQNEAHSLINQVINVKESGKFMEILCYLKSNIGDTETDSR
jgi:hypothetical protein